MALPENDIAIAVYASAWMASFLFFISRFAWPLRWSRTVKTTQRVGVIVLWLHIVIAYWLAHNGSHSHAMEHVAVRTEQIIGYRNGWGIYLNFLVALVWTTVALQNASLNSFTAWYKVICEIFLWLMFISAAILFAQPITTFFFAAIAVAALSSKIYQLASAKGKKGTGTAE